MFNLLSDQSTESTTRQSTETNPKLPPTDTARLAPKTLTRRSPQEILGIRQDPADIYLEDRLLAKGQTFAMLGPGGVGKSRLLLQLAVCLAIGRDFLGLKVTKRKLRWLIIQAENSNWRLQSDLNAIKNWIGPENWALIEQNVIIHTLEQDHDTFLNLDDRAAVKRIRDLIAEVQADVVAFDPLYAFAMGSLNTDAGMIATCKLIAELAREGNPHAAVVILHHALTGKAGMAKAVGFERASYGRGSKALQFWTRAAINIAPASPDKNDRLVVTCGKNSNGPEFQPFGILLNPEKMIYEVDHEFNLQEWLEQMRGSAAVQQSTPDIDVADFVRETPMTKKELVAVIMDETGCGKSTAYNAVKAAEDKTIRRNARREYEAVV